MRPSNVRLAPPLKLAVVGSGPSAFYAASRVLSAFPVERGAGEDGVEVHMFERLPTPFGLTRYGVAPDHPEVKNVEHKFARVAADPRFRFFGNVNVVAGSSTSTPTSGYTYPSARRLTLADLRPHYTQLFLAYGSSQARPLGIPGSAPGELLGVHDALNFVNWYNGHPAAHDEALLAAEPHRRIDLGQGKRHMTVIGAGNVALDVARIVLRGSMGGGAAGGASASATRSRTALAETDIPESVLSHIAASQVERVDIFARRGPAQVAFTNKELREIMALPGVVFEGVRKADMAEAHEAVAQLEARAKEDPSLSGEARVRKRLLGLLEKGGSSTKPQAGAGHKEWGLNFFRAPAAFIGEAGKPIKGVRWNVTSLSASSSSARLPDAPWDPSSQPAAGASPTGNTQETSTDLVVSSVGYRGAPLEGQPPATTDDGLESISLPWDENRGVIPNQGGRVLRADHQQPLAGVYVSGWLARGPVGVIASTMFDANSVADLMVADWRRDPQATLGGGKVRPGPPATLSAKDGQNDAVDWQGWLRIDEHEVKKGAELGKPREKLLAVDEMRETARS